MTVEAPGDLVHQAYAAGRWWDGDEIAVRSPYDGAAVGIAAHASPDAREAALSSAAALFARDGYPRPDVRAELLRRLADAVDADRAEYVELLIGEAGKPRHYAEREVTRAVGVLRAFSGAVTLGTDMGVDLSSNPLAGDRYAVVRRFPRGPVLAITPANSPLNLVVHKLAPAIAVGAPVLVKPHERTPLVALRLARQVHDLDLLPPGALAVLPTGRAEAEQLAADERVAMISFTGSAVGWALKAANPRKHVTLELGGNAALIVAEDADPATAAAAIADGGFGGAGQSCISVQRVLVHASRYDEVRRMLVEHARRFQPGDPADPTTGLGPLSDREIARIDVTIRDASQAGGRVLTGGRPSGASYLATVVEDVPRTAALWRREIFGPVVALSRYTAIDDAFDAVNDSDYGLHAALLTTRLDLIAAAYRRLRVGGLVVGDSTDFRDDRLPYGGTGASGYGREGVHAAIDEMTEPRVLVLSRFRL